MSKNKKDDNFSDVMFKPEYEEIKTFHKMADLKIDGVYRVPMPKMLRELLDVTKGDIIKVGFNAQGDVVLKK